MNIFFIFFFLDQTAKCPSMWDWMKSFANETIQDVPHNNNNNNQSGAPKYDNNPGKAIDVVQAESPKRSNPKPIAPDIPSYQEFKQILDNSNYRKK